MIHEYWMQILFPYLIYSMIAGFFSEKIWIFDCDQQQIPSGVILQNDQWMKSPDQQSNVIKSVPEKM